MQCKAIFAGVVRKPFMAKHEWKQCRGKAPPLLRRYARRPFFVCGALATLWHTAEMRLRIFLRAFFHLIREIERGIRILLRRGVGNAVPCYRHA